MEIIGIVLVYLSGAVICYGQNLYYWNNYPVGRRLADPQENFEAYPLLWKLHFEERWKDILRQRRDNLDTATKMSIASWLGVISNLYLHNGSLGIQYKLEDLPDKEEFRKKTEA